MTTIYDLAKALDLAPSTVSKVLNNYAGVNPETKQKVLAEVARMGYMPNTSARSLKTKRSHNIGVIIYIRDKVDLTHYLFAKILNEFKNILDSRGYDITLISKENNRLNKKSFLDHMRMRGVDGALVLGDYECELIEEILNGKIPSVTFDYGGDRISAVMSDNREKTRELVNYLIESGHRRIKFFHGHDTYVTRERLAGFRAALAENGIPAEDAFFTEAEYANPELTERLTEEFLREPAGCTAIIFPGDHSAMGGLKALYKNGKRIPEDFSVASFDGIEFSKLSNPPLTTVKQDAAKIAKALADTLLNRIDGQSEIVKVVVPAKIIKTESVGKIN